jgi:hypothetical protein
MLFAVLNLLQINVASNAVHLHRLFYLSVCRLFCDNSIQCIPIFLD